MFASPVGSMSALRGASLVILLGVVLPLPTLPDVAVAQSAPSTQSVSVPIRVLSEPKVSTYPYLTEFFMGVAELANGRVLIRDNLRRKLIVTDSLLADTVIISNNEGRGGVTPYPAGAGYATAPLVYRGDTVLLLDLNVPGFVAILPDGKFGPTMSHPMGSHLNASMNTGGANIGFDNRGRFIYREFRQPTSTDKYKGPSSRDTVAILRADFDTRKVDTVATYGVPVVYGLSFSTDVATGQRKSVQTVNPAPMGPDGWAVLSNGTLGIVRAQDYHVDWIAQDGTKSSSGKLPFEWRRISDDEKQKSLDSAKRIIDSLRALPRPTWGRTLFARRGVDGRVIGTDTVLATIEYVSRAEMPDYQSPIRTSSVSADREGNLWILPSTTTLARGGLLYDIVNEKDGLHERVQLPGGCRVAGFGKRGTVFLGCYHESEWRLERRTVVRP